MYTSEIEMSGLEAKKAYADFLADEQKFEDSIVRVFREWPISCEHFLTNESMNRIAWIGQSSMYIATGVPAKYRGGFFLLSIAAQDKANEIAKKHLNFWLNKTDEQSNLL